MLKFNRGNKTIIICVDPLICIGTIGWENTNLALHYLEITIYIDIIITIYVDIIIIITIYVDIIIIITTYIDIIIIITIYIDIIIL